MLTQKMAKQGFARFKMSFSAMQKVDLVFARFKLAIRTRASEKGYVAVAPGLQDLDLWTTLASQDMGGFKEVTKRGNIFDLSFFHVKSLRSTAESALMDKKSSFQTFIAKGGYQLVNCGFFVSPALAVGKVLSEPQVCVAQTPHVDDGAIARDVEWNHGQPEAFTAVVALTQSTTENGATSFWPGSHLLKPTQALKDIDPVIPELKPGEGIAFSFHTVHKGGFNETGADRVLLYLVFHKRLGLKDRNLLALGVKSSLLPVETRSGRGRLVV